MNDQDRTDLLEELDDMQHELEQLAYPPLRPADPSRASEVWEDRVARRHRLGWWIRRAEQMLQEEEAS